MPNRETLEREELDIAQLRTLRQVAEMYPAFRVRYLQYLAQTDEVFLDMAVVRLGRKLFIDLQGLARWVEWRQEK